jgi:hypothetical protein
VKFPDLDPDLLMKIPDPDPGKNVQIRSFQYHAKLFQLKNLDRATWWRRMERVWQLLAVAARVLLRLLCPPTAGAQLALASQLSVSNPHKKSQSAAIHLLLFRYR